MEFYVLHRDMVKFEQGKISKHLVHAVFVCVAFCAQQNVKGLPKMQSMSSFIAHCEVLTREDTVYC